MINLSRRLKFNWIRQVNGSIKTCRVEVSGMLFDFKTRMGIDSRYAVIVRGEQLLIEACRRTEASADYLCWLLLREIKEMMKDLEEWYPYDENGQRVPLPARKKFLSSDEAGVSADELLSVSDEYETMRQRLWLSAGYCVDSRDAKLVEEAVARRHAPR